MNDLKGKVAVVTGASKGIGAAIARSLAAAGAAVAVNYTSSREDADRVVDEIKANGGKAISVKCDARIPSSKPGTSLGLIFMHTDLLHLHH